MFGIVKRRSPAAVDLDALKTCIVPVSFLRAGRYNCEISSVTAPYCFPYIYFYGRFCFKQTAAGQIENPHLAPLIAFTTTVNCGRPCWKGLCLEVGSNRSL